MCYFTKKAFQKDNNVENEYRKKLWLPNAYLRLVFINLLSSDAGKNYLLFGLRAKKEAEIKMTSFASIIHYA